jgi:hypothetical protein
MENKKCHLNFSHPWQEYLIMYKVSPDKYDEFYQKFGHCLYTDDNKTYKDCAFKWIIYNSQVQTNEPQSDPLKILN